ncbi:MAG: methyltransferase domain-containing protein [Candidatus Diapherotrites archaeon]|uniref:Methyltransferase domain-containing protein n=1 Tax=Candidatus Iainarchaeum sp. TaxID=3101447 RepID=A0A938YTR2_9ARCH|nr:methyltransferase domain-containing protein [Candidatus Diapherotrites archaeon]
MTGKNAPAGKSGGKETQDVPLPVFKVSGEKLDLGCGHNKLQGSFGVDFVKTGCADLQWDLDKKLPQKFWGKYDLVFSAGVLDHLGNPLNFLQNCCTYAKPNGFVQAIVDNADYWRYHKKAWPFGNYHAGLWYRENKLAKVQHKMLFQLGHLRNLFTLAGLKPVEESYFWRRSLDYLFPKHLGNAYISIVGKKGK